MSNRQIRFCNHQCPGQGRLSHRDIHLAVLFGATSRRG